MADISPAQRKWIKVLHVAKRDRALDDEAYRALLLGAAGVESAARIRTWGQYDNALSAFKALGFRLKNKAGRESALKETDMETKRDPAWITARQEYYIRGLWDLASRKKDAPSLRALIKRVGGVDDIRFLERKNARKVILALRAIAEKAGCDPDGKEARHADDH
jgi:hypothetical protein